MTCSAETIIDKKVEQQAREIERLRHRVIALEGVRKGLTLANAMLRQRVDLPVDRIPAARRYEEQIRRLRYLVRVMVDNDPAETVSDGGHTVLEVWRAQAIHELEGSDNV
jgi:hypothetical protein